MRRCRNCGTEVVREVWGWRHTVNPDIYGVERLLMCDNVISKRPLDYDSQTPISENQAEPLTESENIIEILNNYSE